MSHRKIAPAGRPTARRIAVLLGAAVLVALGVVAYAGATSSQSATPASAAASKPIVLGSISILTGPVAGIGVDTLRGAREELALINRRGGVDGSKLQLVSTDDANDPGKAVSDASKLIQSSHVTGILGPINSVSGIAIQKLLTSSNTPAVAYQSGAEELTASCVSQQFRTAATLRQLFDALGLYEIEKFGRKRIAFLGWDLAAGKSAQDGTADAAKQKHAKVVYSKRLPLLTQDFSGVIAQAKAAKPDLVMIGAPMPFAGVLAKQIRQNGWNVPLAASGDFVSTDFGGFLGKAADGIFMSDNAHWQASIKQPNGRAFINAFRKKYHRPPNANELVGADTLHTMAEGIQRAGSTDRSKIADALRSKTIPGLRFPIDYNKCGDIKAPDIVGVVWKKGGKQLDLVSPSIFKAVHVPIPAVHH